MLQYLQSNQANLNPPQQNILQQLMQQHRLMQQHQAQLRLQQQQQQQQRAPQVGLQGGQQQRIVPTNVGQQQQQQQNSFQQPPGARTTGGGAVQVGSYTSDGNYSPSTGQTQAAAGLPYKSAGGFQQPQQLFNQPSFTQLNTSGGSNSSNDLGKLNVFFSIFQ
jgi:hypothetical protein